MRDRPIDPTPEQQFAIEAYDYALPSELIAQTPVEPRDASRLMVIHRASGAIEHKQFRDLPSLLSPRDLLVVNRSRVIPARLRGRKLPSGGGVEILLLRRREGGIWDALVRPGRRLTVGTRVGFGERGAYAEIVGQTEYGGRQVRFLDGTDRILEGAPFDQWLQHVGDVPLPPYINEPLDDPERYQTIFAQEIGSAAAPTAGLHFTPELLFRLRDRGIGTADVTLHVGLDTFRPVETEDLRDHVIHSEWCEMSAIAGSRISTARRVGGRVVAVGTTSVRVLESAATQWLHEKEFTNQRDPGYRGDTRLFIYPGYRFQLVDAMITNFHLPRSSLLMLVSAFAGLDLIRRAYQEAIAERYRFYSFGDAMLIL